MLLDKVSEGVGTLEIPYRKGTHITKEDTSDENITYSSSILSLFVLASD